MIFTKSPEHAHFQPTLQVVDLGAFRPIAPMITPAVNPVAVIKYTIERKKMLFKLPLFSRDIQVDYSAEIGADDPVFRNRDDGILDIARVT